MVGAIILMFATSVYLSLAVVIAVRHRRPVLLLSRRLADSPPHAGMPRDISAHRHRGAELDAGD